MKNYTGKIKNTGSQMIPAPYPPTGNKKNPKVTMGEDLRCGRKKGKKDR